MKPDSCTEEMMQVHVNELLRELNEMDVYLMKDFPVYGLTTYRKKMYFNQDLFIMDNIASDFVKRQKRVIRLITIIHETFCHLKRLKYGAFKDILKLTPELKLNENESIKESGTYMEI